jgi:D-alanine-D-alanine ligase
MSKINLAVICGGRNVEHEVSLISAKNILAAVDQAKYNLHLLAIAKDGAFRYYSDWQNFLENADNLGEVSLNNSGFVPVAWLAGDKRGQALLLHGEQEILKFEVVFPIMHGTFAEDGKMQGFLEMLDLAYVGPDVLASSISMDKQVTKQLVERVGVKNAKYLTFTAAKRQDIDFTVVKAELGLPVFVKPANSGSSVGISRATDEASFVAALDQAFSVDHKVLIEEAIVGREIECSVLGNHGELQAGEVGEIVPSAKHGFYSYDAKYIDEAGAALLIPAELSAAKKQEVQKLSKQIFAALGCEGMARVDFFLNEQGEVVFNEINTIPGFTKISMYPKLMMAETGLSYSALVDRLLELALERHKRNSALLLEKKMVE